MYAHQIITDLESFVQKMKALERSGQFSESHTSVIRRLCCYSEISIQDIRSAQKFHFDADVIWEFASGLVDKRGTYSIFDQFTDYMQLPFERILLTWEHARNSDGSLSIASKRALLIQRDTPKDNDPLETWSIERFTHWKDCKCWAREPYIYTIAPGKSFVAIQKENPADTYTEEEIRARIWGDLKLFELFLLFLNCRNIEAVSVFPPQKLNKKRRSKGLVPLFTYKILQIKLLDKKRKALSDTGHTNIHTRIHFCRGHFKEYTAEAPLFGKYVGLWWWQPMVRGQNKKGIVMKDYEVTIDGGKEKTAMDGASMNKVNLT